MKVQLYVIIRVPNCSVAAKHVTVSTVGVLKSMQRMTEEMPYVNLALSLHAPNQEVRLKIVPAASAHHIDKLMTAVDAHIAANRQAYVSRKVSHHGNAPSEEKIDEMIRRSVVGKRLNKTTGIMIEYILIKDVNDRECHALELAELLLPRRDHVILNLIPYNPTAVAEDYEAPTEESVK
jgi:23S rRNA (adenine2503-C2)-methyltransferase